MAVVSPFAQIQDSLPPLTPAPPPISAADLLGLGGGQSAPSGVFAPMPKVSLDQNPAHQIKGAFANGNPFEGIQLHEQQKLANDYQKDADPYGSADNHPGFWGKIAHGLSHATGGDTRRGWEEMGLQKSLQELLKEQSTEAEQGATTSHLNEETTELPGKTASEEGLQTAETGHTNAETEALKNPQGDYEVHDTVEGPMVVNKKTGVGQHLSANGLPIGPKVQTKVVQLEMGGKPHQVLTNEQTGDIIRDMGESGEKPPTVNVNPGTWSIQTDAATGKPILFNSKTGETKDAPANLARKPNAEEIKRNDLAGNVNENLDKLEEIVTRRPDLFGPVAGRLTKGKEAIGTNDADVATLKTIEDNLGMALQSAHGMRSAQHVETSAQSVLNGFKNEPKALLASIKAAKDSVGTFQHDVQNTNEAGHSEGGAPIYARDPQGKLHQAPAGTKLPDGWKREQR